MNWYTSRHVRHPVHPQFRVSPSPPTRPNDMHNMNGLLAWALLGLVIATLIFIAVATLH